MSDVPEAWDQDADWLRERFPFLCSEAFVTAFCERVAEKVSAGVNERHARFVALAELKREAL